jgi:hypothetical protein
MLVKLSEQEQAELEHKVDVRVELETRIAVQSAVQNFDFHPVVRTEIHLAVADAVKRHATKSQVDASIKAATKEIVKSVDYQKIAEKVAASDKRIRSAVATAVNSRIAKEVESSEINRQIADAVREKVFSMLVSKKISPVDLLEEVGSLSTRIADMETQLAAMAEMLGRALMAQPKK